MLYVTWLVCVHWTILENLGWIPLGCGVWCFFMWCWIWFADILLRIFVSVNEVKVLVPQLCLTLCDPMDCSPPSSSVHGILQARIVEWVAMPLSRGSSWPTDQTAISYTWPASAGGFFTTSTTQEAQYALLLFFCLLDLFNHLELRKSFPRSTHLSSMLVWVTFLFPKITPPTKLSAQD